MLRSVALIIFYDQDKRILLQDRRKISKLGEEWGYFGGRIEQGETPEQALVRETKEELAYDLKSYRFLGRLSRESVGDMVIERYVFVAPLPDMKQFMQHEGEAMQLFTIAEAMKLKMVSEGDKEVLLLVQKSF